MSQPALKLTESLPGVPGSRLPGAGFSGVWDDLAFRVAVREGRVMPGLTVAERSVLWAYREHANRAGLAWPSNDTLMSATGLCKSAVQQARRTLVKKGRLAVAEVQDKATRVMRVVVPAELSEGCSGSGGCTGVQGGGVAGYTGGVYGATPEASIERGNEGLAGRAGEIFSSGEGTAPQPGGLGSGGLSAGELPLFEGPAGYEPEATRLLVGLGVKLEVARGLVARYRPTLAELAVVVEVMDAMDAAAAPGRTGPPVTDGNGKPIAAVRSRAKFVEGAVKSGSYGKPRWMGRMDDDRARQAKRAEEARQRSERNAAYWSSLTREEQREAVEAARKTLGAARAMDEGQVLGQALLEARRRRWGQWKEEL